MGLEFGTSQSIRRKNGFTLVMTTVALGLFSVLVGSTLTLVSWMRREQQSLMEKLAVADVGRQLVTVLADGAICSYQLTHPVATFDSTLSPSVPINLASIPQTATGTSAALFSVGVGASPIAPSLVVRSIQIVDITATATSNQFSANYRIDFDSSRLAMPIRPLTIPITILTTAASPSNAKTVQGCGGTAANSRGIASFTTPGAMSFTVPAGVTWIMVEVSGGGGGGSGGGATCSAGGGGAGGYGRSWLAVTPGTVLNGVVGGAGAGALTGKGGDGGASQFGPITCQGGHGGDSLCGSNTSGGAGGACVGSQLTVRGSRGGNGNAFSATTPGGSGGVSAFGGGAVTFTAAEGSNIAMSPGSGGAGSWRDVIQGSSGAAGAIVIQY